MRLTHLAVTGSDLGNFPPTLRLVVFGVSGREAMACWCGWHARKCNRAHDQYRASECLMS